MVMVQYGATPLYISSQIGHVGVVEMLLKNKANIEAANKVRVRDSVLWRIVMKLFFPPTHSFHKPPTS